MSEMLRPFLFLLVLACAGCGVPETTCDCHKTITELNNALTQTETELREFDPDDKNDYADNVATFKNELSEANEVLVHCMTIYREQGPCKEAGDSFWDIGEGYYLPDVGSINIMYTGDWIQDSTRKAKRDSDRENPLNIGSYLDRESFIDSFPRDSLRRTDSAEFREWYRKEVEEQLK